MRLIRLHIDNFGKLSNYDYDFLPGLNVFECPNGWGKSTLRTFLTVMLYDFLHEGAKSDAAYNSERKRFQPWQGGVYGGSLTYEVEGQCYVLTRQFGPTAKGDIYEIREKDTNLVVTNENISLGKKYLGIDRESFVKSVCIEQNGCETVATGDMNAKLGGNAIANDIRVYEKVAAEISERTTQLGSTRKTSVISKHKNQITEMEIKVRNVPILGNAIDERMRLLEEQRKLRNSLLMEREALVAEQKQLSIYTKMKVKKDQYSAICEDVSGRQSKLEQARKEFPGEIPQKSELESCISDATNLEMKNEGLKLAALSDGQLSQYQNLGARFVAGIPKQEDMTQIAVNIKKLNELRIEQAQKSLSQEEQRELSELSKFFKDKPLNNEEVLGIQSDIAKASEIRTELVSKNASKSGMQLVANQARELSRNRSRNTKLMGGVLGGVVLIIGILVALRYLIPGIVLALAGVAIGVVGFVVGGKVDKNTDGDGLEELQRDIDNDEAILTQLNDNVREFVERYGMVYDGNGASNYIYELKSKWESYDKINGKLKALELGNYEERIKQLKDKIVNFLKGYISIIGVGEQDYQDCFNDIENSTITYETLLEKKQRHDVLKEEAEKLKIRVGRYMEKLSLDTTQNPLEALNKAKMQLANYEAANEEYERAVKIKQNFEQEVNVSELAQLTPYEGEYTLESIGDRLRSLEDNIAIARENISKYEKDIEENQEARNELSELEVSIKEEKEKLEQEIKEKGILERTKVFLDSAKVNFTKKYMGPLKAGFDKYYKLMTGEEGDNYYIDANANLQVMEAGAQRDIKFLSSGYRDLVGLCMRMAFVDAMYKNEKPFIIMDDPFVNLDDDKLLGGLKFISEVSKEYQVIYFTCQNGRTR